MGEVTVYDYDRPAAPWPSLALTFELPSKPGALLAQLGAPPSWRDDRTPVDCLAAFVAAAAERARGVAVADGGDGASRTERGSSERRR